MIRRLAENENAKGASVPPEEVARRMEVFADLARKYPPTGPKMTWEEVEKEMDSIFGEDPD